MRKSELVGKGLVLMGRFSGGEEVRRTGIAVNI